MISVLSLFRGTRIFSVYASEVRWWVREKEKRLKMSLRRKSKVLSRDQLYEDQNCWGISHCDAETKLL